MKVFKKAILPVGFQASAAAGGIKRKGKLDLALFYSEAPAKAACLFTVNKIPAACVRLDKASLKNNKAFRAIIANSGNANSFTGQQGLKDAENTASFLAKRLGLKKEAVLVASTGIIARRLPVDKIKRSVPELIAKLSKEGISQAAKAIMTTDTFTKEISVKFDIGNKTVTICGIAKGAGMIAPDMATLLCFIFTDACITQSALKEALRISVDNSFNCITVDGCMSTNDSVMLLANGAAGNSLIEKGVSFNLFVRALNTACVELAKMTVKDGEGATKFIKIKVKNAASFSEARKAALGIANSNLFKTAIYGENPNFGRIVSAVGSSGASVKEEDLKIKVSSLKKKDVSVEVSLGKGSHEAVIYTSDLTPGYVKINAEYN